MDVNPAIHGRATAVCDGEVAGIQRQPVYRFGKSDVDGNVNGLVWAAVSGREASDRGRGDVVGIGHLIDQHLSCQTAGDSKDKLAVRAGHQALDEAFFGVRCRQIRHHLPRYHIHDRQALRGAHEHVQEVAVWTKGQVVGVVGQLDDAPILIHRQVNVAERPTRGRGDKGIGLVWRQNDGPDCAVGDIDALGFAAGNYVEDIKGQGGTVVDGFVIGADGGAGRYLAQIEGAQDLAKSRAAYHHVYFMNGAAAADVADVEATAGMIRQQPIGGDQPAADRSHNCAIAEVNDLHVVGGGVQYVSAGAVGGVSHVSRSRRHRVVG